MTPSFGLSGSAGSLAEGARRLYRRASNTVAGNGWNECAFGEAQKDPYTYVDDDLDSDDDDYGDQAWSSLLRVDRGEEDDDDGKQFAVKETPGKLQQLGYKLSEKGLAVASQAAGVSAEYVGVALKYAATETARDFGWLSSRKSTIDTLKALKARFPVLEDLQRAYEDGLKDGKAETRRRASTTYRTHPPTPGITHPRDVKGPSNLDDRVIMGDSRIRTTTALHMGKRIYDPSIHAGLEEVSADTGDLYYDEEITQSDDVPTTKRPSIRAPSKLDRYAQNKKNEQVTKKKQPDFVAGLQDVSLNDSDDDDGLSLSAGARQPLEKSEEGDDYFSNQKLTGRKAQ